MSSALKILLTNATDIYGGGEYYVLQLARTLQHRGHAVRVTCKPDNLLRSKCESANIEVIPIDFPARGALGRNIRLLRNIVRKHRIDIVHTNSNYDRTAGAFAAWSSRVPHVTNVHSFHSVQHNLTQWFRNRFATGRFIVDGYCVRDLLGREDSIASPNISVIHLGVDPGSMRRDETLRQRVRHEFGFSEKNIVVGNVGRMVPMKGQQDLLKSFGKLAPMFPDGRLLLVGDGELRDELTLLASELNIRNEVQFVGFRDDLQAMYSAFDIYAHASVEGGGETFPFAVLQALAQQLPVVVTRVGDVPYMVEEGVSGFIVSDRDPEAFASAAQKLLGDSSLRTSMAVKSHELFLQRFTLDRMVDKVEEVYRSVLSSEH